MSRAHACAHCSSGPAPHLLSPGRTTSAPPLAQLAAYVIPAAVGRSTSAYVQKIQKAGGIRPYEALVMKSLAAMLEPKFPQLPAEVVPTIVEFWAHAGDYCMPFVPIDLDPLVARIIATLRIRPII